MTQRLESATEPQGKQTGAQNTDDIVAAHDERALQGAARWSTSDYRAMRHNIARSFESGEALRIPALASRARGFVQSLMDGEPSLALGQKCGMDRSDHVAVDLLSNVLTCQNTGANGRHGIGSALEMDRVELDTSTHWAHRENCSHCPVLRLCGGSCMYLDGEEFAQSCENEYQFGLAILDGILRRVAGLKLMGIEGDVRRPNRSKRIPIHPAPNL
jgi:uncharacterized protein